MRNPLQQESLELTTAPAAAEETTTVADSGEEQQELSEAIAQATRKAHSVEKVAKATGSEEIEKELEDFELDDEDLAATFGLPREPSREQRGQRKGREVRSPKAASQLCLTIPLSFLCVVDQKLNN